MPEIIDKPITETIQAKHVFTQEERNTLVDKLTAAMAEEEQIEGEFASAKADFKSRLERVALERTNLAGRLRDKFEMRPTLAVVEFDMPEPGRKSFFRAVYDGTRYMPDDLLREEPMTYEDKQRKLPLEEAAPTNEDLTQSFDTCAGTKDAPPPGYVLVTEGSSREGDIIWNENTLVWEDIEKSSAPLDQYFALARKTDAPAPADESRPEATATTPLAEALAKAAAGKDLAPVPVVLTDDFTADRARAVFRKGAKKAKWPEAAIDLIDGLALQAAENGDPEDEPERVRRVLGVLQPHTTGEA